VSAAADRNLLFGILALQMDFITRDALILAMNDWVLAKAKPLAQILVERQVLSSTRRTMLELLVEEHIKQHDNSSQKSLAAVTLASSVRERLQPIADGELHASLAATSAATQDASPAATRIQSFAGAATSEGQRFRVLRPHARGGLGEVFVARDEELHREVALKQIQERHAARQESRARFLLEAEVTGRLEHPGIVPVYGLGQYADGRPFYAMRFIKGESLEDAITRFHGAGRLERDPGGRSLEFRKLLAQFVDVCNAITYAHSRGVLHRDLKPANVMLGPYGETLVVDWGVAKIMARADGRGGSEETTLLPEALSGSAATVAGSLIGTPQFMSPEQAAGRIESLGPTADVYSLGATLYKLLTGKPPFEGADAISVLDRAQRGDFRSPRQANPAVDRALERVCLKAMALQPEDRYPTPQALANDIDHWLADEPVSAWREPWSRRTRRWLGRHRTLVAATMAALLMATASLGAVTGLLTAANDREQRARAEAVDNFRLARDSVDQYFTQVSESPELKARGLEKLRTRLLETASSYYEKFVSGVAGDTELAAEHGRAYWRLGQLYQDTGRFDLAEKAFRQAMEIQLGLASNRPQEPGNQRDLAKTHHSVGNLCRLRGRPKDAEAELEAAVTIRQHLADELPEESIYQEDLAWSQTVLGMAYRDNGRRDRAATAYQAALALYERLTASRPESPSYRLKLARTRTALGLLHKEQGRLDQAEAEYINARTVYQHLADQYPDVVEYQDDLGAIQTNLGNLYSDTGRYDLAVAAHQAARGIHQRLAEAHPHVPDHQYWLAEDYFNLGQVYRVSGSPELAEAAFAAAMPILRRLSESHPDVPSYHNDLGATGGTLALMYRGTSRYAEAERVLREAKAVLGKLNEAHPGVADYQVEQAHNSCWLGLVLLDVGRHAEAEASLKEALAIQKPLADASPAVADYQVDLAATHRALGECFRETDRASQSEAAYREALRIQEKLAREHGDAPSLSLELSETQRDLGILFQTINQLAAAESAYRQALSIQHRLAGKEEPKALAPQELLAWGHYHLGHLCAETGKNDEAAQEFRRALELWQPLIAKHPATLDYKCGQVLALARLGERGKATALADTLVKKAPQTGRILDVAAHVYALAAKETRKTGTERDEQVGLDASRAVELLRQAQAIGYFQSPATIESLKKCSDFTALRSRDDFKKIIRGR
jgi:serine/threonine-protein kinase